MNLSTGDTTDNLSFSQGEADTIMLSIYAAPRSSGNSNPAVIDAEDTDVYIQAAAISHKYSRHSLHKEEETAFLLCALKILPIVGSFHAQSPKNCKDPGDCTFLIATPDKIISSLFWAVKISKYSANLY